MRARLVLAALMLCFSSSCYATYQSVGGQPFPTRMQAAPPVLSVGVRMNPNSSQPAASSISTGAVADAFARQLSEDKVFEPVIYPYSDLAQAKPDLLLDTTVKVEEQNHMAENVGKAVATGASLFLLGPVLPTRFTVVVDLSVVAKRLDGSVLDTFAHRSEYELKYTTMTPNTTKMQEWLTTAQQHAVQEVVNQIKSKSAALAEAAH